MSRKSYLLPYRALLGGTVFGGLLIFLFPAGNSEYLNEIGLAFFIAVASFAIGGFIGFLFGIPRALQGDKPLQENRYSANTNLEQISDWLTKILIGIGLTQLLAAPEWFESFCSYLGKGFSEKSAPIFCGGIVLYFSISGFLFIYLWARLHLIREFERAEESEERNVITTLLSKLDEIIPNTEGDARNEIINTLYKLQEQFNRIAKDDDKLQRLKLLAQQYDDIRRTMESGTSRTAVMGRIVAEAKAIAGSPGFQQNITKYFGPHASLGQRIIGLASIRATRDRSYIGHVYSILADSRSAHEQYHALRAAEELLGETTDSEAEELSKIILPQLVQGKWLGPENKDRHELAQRILSKLQNKKTGSHE